MSHHTCKAVVLHCMDFRFQKTLHRFFEERYPDGYDNVIAAGGVKDILDHQEKSFVLEQIKLSLQLHRPSEIVLVQHEDCGAYGGSATLGTGEMEYQKRQLEEAELLLRRLFPSVEIKKYIAGLSGSIVE